MARLNIRHDPKADEMEDAFLLWQVIIGIGAKPAVSPFERVGLNTSNGGIQVKILNWS